VAVAALPLVQAPENVASTALLLRGRYDLRGAFLALGMALRLGGIVVGVHFGVWQALALVCAAQLVSTLAIGAAGRAAFGRYPAAAPIRLGSDRREIVGFVVQSSLASGMLSLRTTLAPLLLGVVASPTQLGLYRVAQAPQSGLTAASSPVRLVLLTEQTRDWERGHEQSVMRGVRRYSMAAATLMVVAVPLFYAAMPWLIRVVFGSDGSGATDAARIILFAAAIQLVLGWTKSLPVTIGKPRLRLVTHGLETVVLLPLTVAFGAAWGATGAALAMLVAAFVFAAAWAVALTRIRAEVELRAGRGAGSAALP
jgi:O-antigen/teichoic acid export membrane protein